MTWGELKEFCVEMPDDTDIQVKVKDDENDVYNVCKQEYSAGDCYIVLVFE